MKRTRRCGRAAGVLAALALGAACAPAHLPPTAAKLTNSSRALPARVSALAPDFAARVQQALRAAAQERSAVARAEQLKRATWLQRAAEAEADRIEFERAFAGCERRIAKALRERSNYERQRLAAERDRSLRAAAEHARSEAAWVFAELLRSPGRAGDTAAERERISQFLLQRAQALIAGALALGGKADDPQLESAVLQITAAASAAPSARIATSRQALLAAERALGTARNAQAQHERAHPAELQDLLEGLRERGFHGDCASEGTVVELPPAFAARSSEPSVELQRRLQLLRELLPAFPLGQIQIAYGGELAVQRAERIAATLAVTLDHQRLSSVSAETSDRLRIVLKAYACGPQGPAVTP